MARAQPIEKWRNIFNMFPQWMWFFIILIGYASGTVYNYIFQFCERQQFDFHMIMLSTLLLSMGMSAPGSYVPHQSLARIYFVFLAVYGMFFTIAVNNVLLDVVTWTKAGIQIDTFEMMAAENYRFLDGTAYGATVAHHQLCPTTDECLATLNHDFFVAILSSRQEAMMCQLMIPVKLFCATKNVINYPVAMLVRRDFIRLAEMNQVIRRFQESGLMQKWYKERINNVSRAGAAGGETQKEYAVEALLIEHMTGAIVVIVAGTALSTLTFIAELYVHAKVMKRKSNQPFWNRFHVIVFVARVTRNQYRNK